MNMTYTIEDVKNFVYKNTSDTVKVLSTEYINSKSPLLFLCKCGDKFTRSWINYRKSSFYCTKCANKTGFAKQSKSIQEIKDSLSKDNAEFVSGEYINQESILSIRCACGEVFETSWKMIKRGKVRCDKCQKEICNEEERKYTLEEAINVYQQFGYEFLDDWYTNVRDKHNCRCKNNHLTKKSIVDLEHDRSGCVICQKEYQIGENAANYKGGITPLYTYLRNNLDDWKNIIRDKYGGMCPITGHTGFSTEVHHLTSFNTICSQIFQDYSIDPSSKTLLKDIQNNPNYNEIIEKIILSHDENSGILIDKDIHLGFHKEFGYGENTPEQFNNFLIKHYAVTLTDLMKGKGNLYG